jgi:hypothetical protein
MKTATKGLYSEAIPNYQPTPLNKLLSCHWAKRGRLKRSDYQIIGHYLGHIPKATGKRRVTVTITLAPRQRAGDPDSYLKVLGDALVNAEILLDDNRQWVEWAPVEFVRGPGSQTRITLEDIA